MMQVSRALWRTLCGLWVATLRAMARTRAKAHRNQSAGALVNVYAICEFEA
jgi:hypothetical protein